MAGGKDPAREERLKAALRENLKRRKAQMRGREASDGKDGHAAPPTDGPAPAGRDPGNEGGTP